jgi:hypothetical protein
MTNIGATGARVGTKRRCAVQCCSVGPCTGRHLPVVQEPALQLYLQTRIGHFIAIKLRELQRRTWIVRSYFFRRQQLLYACLPLANVV